MPTQQKGKKSSSSLGIRKVKDIVKSFIHAIQEEDTNFVKGVPKSCILTMSEVKEVVENGKEIYVILPSDYSQFDLLNKDHAMFDNRSADNDVDRIGWFVGKKNIAFSVGTDGRPDGSGKWFMINQDFSDYVLKRPEITGPVTKGHKGISRKKITKKITKKEADQITRAFVKVFESGKPKADLPWSCILKMSEVKEIADSDKQIYAIGPPDYDQWTVLEKGHQMLRRDRARERTEGHIGSFYGQVEASSGPDALPWVVINRELSDYVHKQLEVRLGSKTKNIEFVIKLCCIDHFLSRIRDHTMSIDLTGYNFCNFTTARVLNVIVFIFTLFRENFKGECLKHAKCETWDKLPCKRTGDYLKTQCKGKTKEEGKTIFVNGYENMFNLLQDIQLADDGPCVAMATYSQLWTEVYETLHKNQTMTCSNYNVDRNILRIEFKKI